MVQHHHLCLAAALQPGQETPQPEVLVLDHPHPANLRGGSLSLWASAIVASLAGGYDDSSGSSEEHDADIDDSSTFDGTGPTIHYNP